MTFDLYELVDEYKKCYDHLSKDQINATINELKICHKKFESFRNKTDIDVIIRSFIFEIKQEIYKFEAIKEKL